MKTEACLVKELRVGDIIRVEGRMLPVTNIRKSDIIGYTAFVELGILLDNDWQICVKKSCGAQHYELVSAKDIEVGFAVHIKNAVVCVRKVEHFDDNTTEISFGISMKPNSTVTRFPRWKAEIIDREIKL